MANPWFRLYHEFSTDPKIQMMSEANQRRFVMLLCLRCCNGDVTLHDEEVAFQLRISNEEWLETKALFIAKGFIDEAGNVLNWDKRQFVSDSSAARVAKHRANKKRKCNVTETPPDTETDTDTEEDKKNKKGVKFVPPSLEEVAAYCKERNNSVVPAKFHSFYSQKGWMVGKNKMKDWKQAIISWENNDFQPATKIQSNAIRFRKPDNFDAVSYGEGGLI